jgi:hypothetical protein
MVKKSKSLQTLQNSVPFFPSFLNLNIDEYLYN